MYPVIRLFNFGIPTYWVCAIVGFALAILLFIHTGKKYRVDKFDLLYASIYCIVGILIGSKLLFVITTLPEIIRYFEVYSKYIGETLSYMFGGYVFYGGLIGGALGIIIYSRKFMLALPDFADSVAPAVPLMHAFGRFGCFFAGCCYGEEYHGIGAITFPNNEITHDIAGIPRFPTQLIEAGFDLILCVFLYLYIKKKPKPYSPIGIYLAAYTLMRFVIEFFRGDSLRGILLGLSTSQWISILLFPLGLWLIFRRDKQQQLNM